MIIRSLFIVFILAFSWISASPSRNPSKKVFYLVRHGQTDWNVEKRVQGHIDIPLNDQGRQEAWELAEILKDISFSACFSSDLQRAHETALILTSQTNLPVITDVRLRERDLLLWGGRLFAEYHAASDEERKKIESDDSMYQRTLECLQEKADNSDANEFLIVTHRGVMKLLLIRLCDLHVADFDIDIGNAALLKLCYSEGKWIVEDTKKITIKQN